MDGAEVAHTARSDESILRDISAGDVASFTQLVIALDADLIRVAFVVTGDIQLARDAVQDTWEGVWRSPPRLRDASSLKSWLLTVTTNHCLEAMRRSARRSRRESFASPVDRVDEGASLMARLEVEDAMRALEPAEREIVALRYVLEYSSQDLATHYGIGREAARSRLHRVMQKLREVVDAGVPHD
jgi:RNA polymerase sigma-70 factor (ECF subfamily)